MVFDNLPAHLGPAVAEAIEGAGARVLRLPRPWVVALLGLAVTALLVCALRAGGEKLLVWLPDWLEQAGVFVVAYLVAAVVVARLVGPPAGGR